MIRSKYNLRCTDGHYHYSPSPNAFVGLGCGKPTISPVGRDGNILRNVPKCFSPLKILK